MSAAVAGPGAGTYVPATRPTFYFIGVTTGASSIMRVFPAWAGHLGLDAAMVGIDLPLHAPAAAYRAQVEDLMRTMPSLMRAVGMQTL